MFLFAVAIVGCKADQLQLSWVTSQSTVMLTASYSYGCLWQWNLSNFTKEYNAKQRYIIMNIDANVPLGQRYNIVAYH